MGGGGGGAPMSHIDLRNDNVSVAYFPQCRMSTIFLHPMSHVTKKDYV